LFFQVGRYYEFYAELNGLLLKILGLSPIKKSNCGVIYAFPVSQQKCKINSLLSMGYTVVFIFQDEHYLTRIKRRSPKLKMVKI